MADKLWFCPYDGSVLPQPPSPRVSTQPPRQGPAQLSEAETTYEKWLHSLTYTQKLQWYQKLGYLSLLKDFPNKVQHLIDDYITTNSNGDIIPHELIEIQLNDDQGKPARILRGKDFTTLELFALRVPPEISTCREALAWTFRMNEGNYHPNRET